MFDSRTVIVVGVLDDVVVREDEAGLAVDDEAAARALLDLRDGALPPRCRPWP